MRWIRDTHGLESRVRRGLARGCVAMLVGLAGCVETDDPGRLRPRPSPGPVATTATAGQPTAAPAPERTVTVVTGGPRSGPPSPVGDARAAASVESQPRGRGALPTATPTMAAAARDGDMTPAPGTPAAVTPAGAREPTAGAGAAGTPGVPAQPTREGTPTGTPAAVTHSAPDVEPERTPTAEPVSLSGVMYIQVHLPEPTTPCRYSREWGTWQRRQSVAWSPDGSKIFFTLGGAIFVAPADGSRVRQVADAQVAAAREIYGFELPGLGPDADRRAIEAELRARYGIIQEIRLGPMSAISMSPDGMQLLYSTCAFPRLAAVEAGRPPDVDDYEYGLAIQDVAGGAARRLTTGDRFENFPAWSPDGTRIAFLSGRSGYVQTATRGTRGPLRHVRLNTMAADGSDRRDLTDGTEVRELLLHPPQWSPDGQRLAFIAVTREGEGREAEPSLYTVRADGTEFQRLTAAVSPPSWSPDGLRLAVARPVGADAVELITLQADGTDVRPVTTGESGPRPAEAWIETMAWSPAGDQILYSCGAGFCVTDTDGTSVDESLLYTRGGQPVAAWSPDGSRIAVVLPPEADAKLIAYAEVILEHVAPDWTDGRRLVYAFESPGLAWAGAPGERTDARRVERARGPPTRPVAALARDLDAAANQAACATGYVVPEPEANPGLVRDCQVLAGLAPDDDGRPRWNWNAGTPVDQWEGVIVAGNPRRVTELWLAGLWPPSSRALSAPEAASIAQLAELRVLNLGSTPLRGPIPAQWGSLEKLQTLVLYNSEVSGPIPPDLGNLSGLRTLNLARNNLTGPLPPVLGQLARLETLALRGNALSGVIPSAFGRLTELVTLDLSYNRLTGPLPPDLGQLASLETLDLEGNDLTGAIPSEWCQLASISTLTLRRNRLSGPIPDCLGELPNLDRLHLEHNQLTGAIPATLAQAKRLDYAALDGNQLTGCVPPGLKVRRRDELGLPDCEAGT